MEKKEKYILLIIFTLTIVLRLIAAFTIPYFTHDSYFNLRQVEQISENGLPQYQDPLSYGGREIRFLPLFHYITALFDLILPLEIAAKILSNLFIATIPIITYFISKKITTNQHAPFFSAIIAAMLPVLATTNSFTTTSLFLSLAFLAIYAFITVNEKKTPILYVISFILLCFASSATILLIVGFGIYLLLSLVEGKKIRKIEVELILFSVFFYIWSQFILFKDSFIQE